MLTKDQVRERTLGLMSQQLGIELRKIKPESRFVEDLGCDSLDGIELVLELEEEFDISLPDNEDALAKYPTVGQAIAALAARLEAE